MNRSKKTSLGTGALYNNFAQWAFWASGWIIYLWLATQFDSADYGRFGLVINTMATMNMFLSVGFPRGAAKFISEDESRLSGVIRDMNRIQLFMSLLFSFIFIILSFLINDLSPYFRICALCFPAYGFFAAYGAGYLNGLKYFAQQAFSNIMQSLVKVIAIFVLVLLGLGIEGVGLGYFLGAVVGFLFAWKYLGPVEKASAGFGWKKIVGFALPVSLFAAVYFSLVQISLWAVRLSGIGDEQVGYYTAAILVARFSHAFTAGIGVTLFPTISGALANNDMEQARNYIMQSLRYSFILLMPVLCLISITSTELIDLALPSEYTAADSTVSILVFGAGSIAILTIMVSIIMGSGKPWVSFKIVLVMLAIEIGMNALLIPKYGMEGAAWAHTITSISGLILASMYIWNKFGVLVNLLSITRIIVASAAVYIVVMQLSFSPILLPIIYAGAFSLYVALMVIMRELRKEDWHAIKQLIPIERILGRS